MQKRQLACGFHGLGRSLFLVSLVGGEAVEQFRCPDLAAGSLPHVCDVVEEDAPGYPTDVVDYSK